MFKNITKIVVLVINQTCMSRLFVLMSNDIVIWRINVLIHFRVITNLKIYYTIRSIRANNCI